MILLSPHELSLDPNVLLVLACIWKRAARTTSDPGSGLGPVWSQVTCYLSQSSFLFLPSCFFSFLNHCFIWIPLFAGSWTLYPVCINLFCKLTFCRFDWNKSLMCSSCRSCGSCSSRCWLTFTHRTIKYSHEDNQPLSLSPFSYPLFPSLSLHPLFSFLVSLLFLPLSPLSLVPLFLSAPTPSRYLSLSFYLCCSPAPSFLLSHSLIVSNVASVWQK